jgi:hypothetical protein
LGNNEGPAQKPPAHVANRVARPATSETEAASGITTGSRAPVRVRPILDALVVQLTAQLEATNVISHPGENGRAREQIVKAFLTSIIPETFAVTSGFVIDASGAISRQIDLLIYRRGYHPVFRVGEVPLVLVEATAAAIEVRAAIDSEIDLRTALENLASVRRLDRTNGGLNYTVEGSQPGARITDNYAHRIFTAAVTERSLTPDVLAQKLLAFMRANPRRLWPNTYVDIRVGDMAFANVPGTEPMETNWSFDKARAMTMTEAPSSIAPLLQLARSLLDFLRITPLIDYLPASYLDLPGEKHRWWRLNDPEMP